MHAEQNSDWTDVYASLIRIFAACMKKQEILSSPLSAEQRAWHRGYKTFFMLHTDEHEISTTHKTKIPTSYLL